METATRLPSQDVIGVGELTESKKGKIWIINTSDSHYPSGAEVYITLKNGDQSTVFAMPRTWLPIELTERYPRKVITTSSYFIEAISKGLITAITEEAAAKLLSQKGVERERARLKEIEDAIKAATSARGIGKNVMISTGDPERDAELSREFNESKSPGVDPGSTKAIDNRSFTLGSEDESEEEGETISPNFQAWVHKLNAMENEEDARTEIRMRGSMTIEEASYLLKNISHETIQTLLRKKLKKIGEAV